MAEKKVKKQKPFYILNNVRCSFPALFERPTIDGKLGKCGSKFLLDPKIPEQKEMIIKLRKVANAIMIKEIKVKIGPHKWFIRNGDNEDRPEYSGFWIVSANVNPPAKPLVLAGNGKTAITTEEDCKIYSGCRVNAKIQPWGQKNKWGKRVNATLVAIQFAGDDEPLSASHVPTDVAMEGFSAVDTGDEFDEDYENDDDVLDLDDDEDLDLDDDD